MEYTTLRNGLELPKVGLGTWQITDGDLVRKTIAKAYEEGYRLIDTATAYSNEITISKAIAEAGILREDLLITDKVWNTSRGYDAVQRACRKSLKRLKTDYLDMYLIHWPASMKLYPNWAEINADTWRGMEALYQEGIVKAIGVCNFKPHHFEVLRKTAKVMPFVNQIEFHPGMNQEETYQYCVENDIQVEASSPLGNGQIMKQPLLERIAENKEKTSAQICLRWELQKGLIVIPKTEKPERLHTNIDIFDFTLTDEEMAMIDALPYCGGIGIDPDEVTEFG